MNTVVTNQPGHLDAPPTVAASFSMIEGINSLAARAGRGILDYIVRRNQRRALLLLNYHMLNDIGMTRAEIERETASFRGRCNFPE